MSWDIIVFNLSKKVTSVEEIDEEILMDMASNKEFRKLLNNEFPTIKWNENCAIVEKPGVYIEIYIGPNEEETFTHIIFFLRDGESSLFEIISLCKKHNWQLFDTSLGEMIDLENPEKNGYVNYNNYVSQIVDNK